MGQLYIQTVVVVIFAMIVVAVTGAVAATVANM